VTDRFFLDVRKVGNAAKMQPLLNAINAEDPLPCALICAAFIDKCLLGILETLFVKGRTSEQLLRSDSGLLGSLYSRAKIVYLMGHIDSHLFTNVGHICTIRNLFAHSHEPLSFDSPEVAKLCKELKERVPQVTVEDPEAARHFANLIENDPRYHFTNVAMATVIELMDSTWSISKKLEA